MDTIGADQPDTLFDPCLPPSGWDDFATKRDIARLEAKIDGKVESLESRIDGKVADLRSDMNQALRAQFYALVVVMVATAGLAVALVR
ncbi:MAG: hypothetical protein ACRDPB_00060 [Nocardioidaceae bacterium]